MKSCGVIFLIAVVYLSQLKKIRADMQDPVGTVPITIPVGPDQEGPACRTCCPAAVPAVRGNPGHMGPSGFPGLPGEQGDPGLDGLKGTTEPVVVYLGKSVSPDFVEIQGLVQKELRVRWD